ncbi:hypothetical protein VTH06DRAFT_2354 [Thermothelomyces fergusii]
MARPANAAVRETRRQSSPRELQSMDVSKALTAAEHSRRQFILNFAASRDTQLLIPGKKSDAVKAAEEWVAVWLRQNGYRDVKHDFFRYTVDARLWAAHVGDDIDFPFAFMRGRFEASVSDGSEADDKRPDSEPSLDAKDIEAGQGDVDSAATPPPPATPVGLRSPKRQQTREKQQSAPSTPLGRRQRSTTYPESPHKTALRDRSISLTSFDKPPKAGQDKIPLLARLGRSWSRRFSSASTS